MDDEKKWILDRLEKNAARLTKADFSKIMDGYLDTEHFWDKSSTGKTLAFIKEIFKRVPKDIIQEWFEGTLLLKRSLDICVYKELLTKFPELVANLSVDALLSMVITRDWNVDYTVDILLILNTSLQSKYFQTLTNMIVDAITEFGHGPMPQLMKLVEVLCYHMNTLGVFTPLEDLTRRKVNIYPIVLELADGPDHQDTYALKIAARIIEQYRTFVNVKEIEKFLKVCLHFISSKYHFSEGLAILTSFLKQSPNILRDLGETTAFPILREIFGDPSVKYHSYILEQLLPLLKEGEFIRLLQTIKSDRSKEALRTYKSVLEQDTTISVDKLVTFFSAPYEERYISKIGQLILGVLLKRHPSFFTDEFDRLYNILCFDVLALSIQFVPQLIERTHLEKVKELLIHSQSGSPQKEFAIKLIGKVCSERPDLIREQDIYEISAILKTEYCDLVHAMKDPDLRMAFDTTLTILRKNPSIIKPDHLRSFLRRLDLLGGHLDLRIVMDAILNIIRCDPKSREMVLKMFHSMFKADYAYHSLPEYIKTLFEQGLDKEDAVQILLEGTKLNSNPRNLEVLSEIETIGGNYHQALAYLKQALEIAADDEFDDLVNKVEDSEDLAPLRKFPAYHELLEEFAQYLLQIRKQREEKFEKELTTILTEAIGSKFATKLRQSPHKIKLV